MRVAPVTCRPPCWPSGWSTYFLMELAMEVATAHDKPFQTHPHVNPVTSKLVFEASLAWGSLWKSPVALAP